jgi:hypothetical protein
MKLALLVVVVVVAVLVLRLLRSAVQAKGSP